MDKSTKISIFLLILTVLCVVSIVSKNNYETSTSNICTVIFESDGETVETKEVIYKETVDKISITKDGYNFIYWEFDDNEYDFDSLVTRNITLVAKWEKDVDELSSYTITFVSDEQIIETKIVNYNSFVETVDITKDNYIFKYWSYNDEQFHFDTLITQNITLVAVWILESEIETYYIVTFNTGSEEFTQTVAEGTVVKCPQPPSNDIKEFMYWEYDDAEFNFDTLIKSNITLTAKWEDKKFIVNFDTDGGTLIESKEVLINSCIYVENPNKNHYEFLYWEYNDEIFDFNTLITSDITLKAIYTEVEYEVTFVSDNEKYDTKYVKYNHTVESLSITKDGYVFRYWEYNNEQFHFDTLITSDITLKAVWIEEENIDKYYIVTFNTGSDVFTQSVAEGTLVTKPTDPENELKTFIYWICDGFQFDFNMQITSDKTLTAKWEDTKYTISFQTDGGTVMPDITVLINSKLNVDDPIKPNFKFLYWQFDNEKFDKETLITEDMILTAVWQREYYSVTFVSIGTQVESQLVSCGGNVTKPVDPTHEQRRFLYWSYNNEEFNFDTILEDDILLVAVFSDIEYTVVFDTDGANEIMTQTVSYSQLAVMPANPTKEGYEFLYWTLNDEQFLFNTEISSNIILKALWKVKTNELVYYTITFTSNGGSATISQQVVDGGLIVKPMDPTRDNYDFTYWTYSNTEYNFDSIVTSNMTLVANWKIHSFTVTFDVNGGSYVASQVVDMFSKATNYTTYKNDYNFLYWELNEEEFNFNTLITSDITLVAKWEIIVRYSVSYDSDGGSDVDTQLVESGKSAAIPYNPTKSGYIFAYWMYDGEQFDFTTIITSDITLVAYWVSSSKVIVTFDSDGGDLVATQTLDSMQTVTVPTSPTKSGYIFKCWNLDDEEYKFSTLVSTNITLVAVWYKIPVVTYYTITFMSNDSVYTTRSVQENTATASLSISTTSTHRFSHWECGGEVYDFNTLVTEDFTLIAVWNERIYYTITYELDGGSFYNTSHVYLVEEGYKPTSFTSPTKAFHTFVEWQLPDGTKYTFNSVATYTDIHVTAIWKQDDLDLSYVGKSLEYTSYSNTFAVAGNIPTGVTVTYDIGNVFNNVGTYVITATATYDSVVIWSQSATFIITPINLTLSYTGDFEYEYSSEFLIPNVAVSGSGWAYYENRYSSYRGNFLFNYSSDMIAVGLHTITITLVNTTNSPENYILINDTFNVDIIAVRSYNFETELVDGELSVTGFYNSLQTTLEVPSHINGVPVTKINSYAFKSMTLLTSVSLPDTIKLVDSYAFQSCTSLTTVNLGNGITKIGDYAFDGCSKLVSMSYGNELRTIGNYAFQSCTVLAEINGGASVQTVGNYAFSYCYKITSLPFGSSIETIGNYAFRSCTLLTELNFSDSLISIGNYAFYNCNKVTILNLSSNLQSIGTNAFEICTSLTSVVLPNSLTTIGNYAFYKCTSITTVTISNQLETLSSYVFDGCTKIVSVNFSNTVNLKTIQSYAFRSNIFEEITIPNSVTTLGNYAFASNTKLKSIILPDAISSIGTYMFSGCTSLVSYTLPANIQTISNYMFNGCTSLTSIYVPSTITTLGDGVFNGCKNVEIITLYSSNTLESIGSSAFNGMSLIENFSIPITVKTIGSSAFYGWSSLKSITIPAAVTSIGYSAFYNCTSLTSITIPSTVTSMGYSMFRGCTSLVSVVINAPIITLPSYIFYGCTSLTTITLPNTIKTFDDYAFYSCSALSNFTIDSNVTRINEYVFGNCDKLESITIPINVITMEYYVFRNSDNINIFVEAESKPSGWNANWSYGIGTSDSTNGNIIWDCNNI